MPTQIDPQLKAALRERIMRCLPELPAHAQPAAADAILAALQPEIQRLVVEARIKELQWAMYTIGDLHMERVGRPEDDFATNRVEHDRRQHHRIIKERIDQLTQSNQKERL